MFFLFGIGFGAVFAIVALAMFGIPLLGCSAFGLLWGDRRIWWALAAIVAIPAARLAMSSWTDYDGSADPLAVGFRKCVDIGVVGGAAFGCVAGMWLLSKFGSSWQPRALWLSAPVSAIAVLFLVGSAVGMHGEPARIRETKSKRRITWIEALQGRDLATIADMAKAGHGDFRRLRELGSTPYELALRNRDLEMLETLARHDPKAGISASRALAESAQLATIDRFLTVSAAAKRIREELLKHAIDRGREDLFEHLLAGGVDVDARDGRTPLMHAAYMERIDFARTLLARGAEVNVLTQHASSVIGETALEMAIYKENRAMTSLLLEHGADPNLTRPSSRTALMRACQANRPELVALLLARGASVRAANHQKRTPLHFALAQKQPQRAIVDALLAAGADRGAADKFGRTPDQRLLELGYR